MKGRWQKSCATFSDDRLYRYALWRAFRMDNPGLFCTAAERYIHTTQGDHVLAVCMLNPSTADERKNDPTIERCERFALRNGYTALLVLNLYGYRSTSPEELLLAKDPVGPDWDQHILVKSKAAKLLGATFVEAWGAAKAVRDDDRQVRRLRSIWDDCGIHLRFCFGLTKDGHPRHPLYMRSDVELRPAPGSVGA